MADDFEERGFDIVRYSLEPQYADNKEKIRDCDIVFVAVPTPSTPDGFDDSIVRSAVKLVGAGRTVVIKSTILPGITELLQKENPDIFVLHSPEFLREVTAVEDTRHPERNIVGVPVMSDVYQSKAEAVLAVLPTAPYAKVMLSKESELVKYVGNNFLFAKVVFMNMMYDLAGSIGADWSNIADAVSHDSRIGKSHMLPVHISGHATTPGRGAGGHCFPKDFEAILQFYKRKVGDKLGVEALAAMRNKNVELLTKSNKDLDILKGIYRKLW